MSELKSPACLSIFALILSIPVSGFAQNPLAQMPPSVAQPSTPSAFAPARIAFVNIQQLIAVSEEGKNESSKWQQWAEKKRAELQSMQKELDALRNKLEVQGPKLTEDARADLADLIDAKDTLLQRAQQDSQKESDKRRQRLADTIYRKALPVLAKLAKENNLDLVLFIDGNRDAYISPSLIVTDAVIQAYNAAYPVAQGEVPVKKQ